VSFTGANVFGNPFNAGPAAFAGLSQGQAFSVVVPALVSKSRGLGPLMRDVQSNGVGTVDPQWSGGTGAASPNDFTGGMVGNNMQIRSPSYDPFSQSIGVPNPFVGGKYAAINNGAVPATATDNYLQFLHWKFSLPSTIQSGDTCCIYMRWWERNDPTTNLGASGVHNSGYNNKIFAYGPGGYQTTFGNNNPPQSWLTALPNSGNATANSSLTWSGGVATVTTVANIPDLNIGDTFTSAIAGVTPSGYNKNPVANCTVIAANQFTYAVATDPGGPSTVPGTYLTAAITPHMTDCQLHNADNLASGPFNPGSVLEYPDRNGHSNDFFNHRLNTYNPANGWAQIECEICIDTATGAGGHGYFRYIVNGQRASTQTVGTIINYAGRTDNFMAIDPVLRAIDIGCGLYIGSADDPNNVAYLSDIYFDISAGNVIGQCARLIAGDANTYNACAILEPQIITTMVQGGGQTTVSCNSFWKGALATGAPAYWYWVGESGTVVPSGSTLVN
jgi:hypothetical protein